MSINCLLTNDVIIEKLSALIINSPPVNTIVESPFAVNEWFAPNNIEFTKSTIENVSTNYISSFGTQLPNLVSLKAITPTEIILLSFPLPVDFNITRNVVVPCVIKNYNKQANNPSCILQVQNNVYVAPNITSYIIIDGLDLPLGGLINIFPSSFTLFKGQ